MITISSILEIQKMVYVRVGAIKNLVMVLFMKVIGLMICLTDKELLPRLTVVNIMVNLKMIDHMVMECFNQQMVL
jgi:hypothetical protein